MELSPFASFGAAGLLIVIAWLFKDHPKHGWVTRIALPLGVIAAAILAGIQVYEAWFAKDPIVRLKPEGAWSAFRPSGDPVRVDVTILHRGEEQVIDGRDELKLKDLEDRVFQISTAQDRLRLLFNGLPYGHVPLEAMRSGGWYYSDMRPPKARIITKPLYKGDEATPIEGLHLRVRDWNYSEDQEEAGAMLTFKWGEHRKLSCDLNRHEWKYFEYPGEVRFLAQALWLNHLPAGEENITVMILQFPSRSTASKVEECEPLL